ncbi:homeobox-leucine zipper protein HOX12 [Elaeis guineensis]|uniref:Homeobox-leucine zipper protein n=1 Tax=Elaeis guineensis var. tenera TaxID=51953 RepID=A0A6I9SGZ8_ELAGV|nr:homeobox-leucine zipper protein HOX12 [Elaeis guineensis]
MTKAIPSQVEEELASLMNFGMHSQRTEGETRTRRRRRKPKANGAEGEARKRRLTDAQVEFLEMSFGKERKLESGRKVHLAGEIGLDPKQVAVWFQNRRARHKNKQLEEEYLKLKSAHDAIVVEKCHLENEVLKLKEKLSKAEESIRKLSETVNGACGGGGGGSGGGGESGGSPTSSFSTVTYHPLVGEFGVDGEVDFMYIPEYYFSNYMDWGNPYGIL